MNDTIGFPDEIDVVYINDRINGIAERIGEAHGWKVTAKMASLEDVKCRWTRTPIVEDRRIDFFISDYLDDAPDEVLESLLDNILTSIENGTKRASPEGFKEYLFSDEFRNNHRRTYLERKDYSEDDGRLSKIADNIKLIIDSKRLTVDFNKIFFGYTDRDSLTFSTIFSTVLIPKRFKDEGDKELGMLLYAGLKAIGKGIHTYDGPIPHLAEYMFEYKEKVDVSEDFYNNVMYETIGGE